MTDITAEEIQAQYRAWTDTEYFLQKRLKMLHPSLEGAWPITICVSEGKVHVEWEDYYENSHEESHDLELILNLDAVAIKAEQDRKAAEAQARAAEERQRQIEAQSRAEIRELMRLAQKHPDAVKELCDE